MVQAKAFEVVNNEGKMVAVLYADEGGGTSGDWNGDGIPDECQSLADIDDDGEVTVLDLVLVISNWGQIGDPGILGDATWFL